MLALFGNFGALELVLIGIVAVLVFGKDLPQAAGKAYLQLRKLRNAVDDLRRDSGIERELRNIERSVREAEWEARRKGSPAGLQAGRVEPLVARRELPVSGAALAPPSAAPQGGSSAVPEPPAAPAPAPHEPRGEAPTDAAS